MLIAPIMSPGLVSNSSLKYIYMYVYIYTYIYIYIYIYFKLEFDTRPGLIIGAINMYGCQLHREGEIYK